MAKFENGQLRGMIGDIVICKRGDSYYARSKPRPRIKKKGLTTTTITVMKKASTYGSSMLAYLKNELLFDYTLASHNGFRGWLCKVQHNNKGQIDWPLAMDFSLFHNINPAAQLEKTLRVMPIIEGYDRKTIYLNFPAFDPADKIIAPPYTKKVLVKLLATTHPFSGSSTNCGFGFTSFEVDHKKVQKERQLELPLTQCKSGDVVLLTLALQYSTHQSVHDLMHPYVKDLKWLPAGVIAMGRI